MLFFFKTIFEVSAKLRHFSCLNQNHGVSRDLLCDQKEVVEVSHSGFI